jgi:flavin-dependent thymidylate synthase
MSQDNAAQNLIGHRVNVLDKGYVELQAVMGNDLAIVNAARVSFLGESKGNEKDKKLLFYLLRNRHCYHPTMEVLTLEGWKRWDECNDKEIFLVPDPCTRTLRAEQLPIERFDAEEPLVTFQTRRMSFAVTTDHRMWFRKKKYRCVKRTPSFQIYQAALMPRWGHFDPLKGYHHVSSEGDLDPVFQFIGFYLGDGSYASRNRVTFHLRKYREKQYLRQLLEKLNYCYWEVPSTTYHDATVFRVETPTELRIFTNYGARCREKAFDLVKLRELSPAAVRGLFDGLVNSDGSIKRDRAQIQFNVTSPHLEKLFMALAAFMGIDAHKTSTGCTAFTGQRRTSLEARKSYFGEMQYSGPVYCATTSTGFLMVRGAENKFAFVCGNTSPFEMVEFKFRIRCPLVTWWQLVRHRTLSLNLQSARYLPFEENDFYVPDAWRKQATDNKQASAGELEGTDGIELTQELVEHYTRSYALYENAMQKGVAREMARLFLPGFAVYYTGIIKVDAHNLMHFMHLRMAPDAQYEIRVYATAIYEHFFKPALPWTAEAFEKYVLQRAETTNQPVSQG